MRYLLFFLLIFCATVGAGSLLKSLWCVATAMGRLFYEGKLRKDAGKSDEFTRSR